MAILRVADTLKTKIKKKSWNMCAYNIFTQIVDVSEIANKGIQNQVPEIRNPRPLNSESKTALDYLAWSEAFFILPAFYFRSFQYAEVIKFAAKQAS